jgi:hypothetical protein
LPAFLFTRSFIKLSVVYRPTRRYRLFGNFLYILLEAIVKRDPELSPFKKEDPPETTIKKLLDAQINELWDVLKEVSAEEPKQGLSIIVDGLNKVEHQKVEFAREVCAFISYLQKRNSKVKVLLTSRPQAEIKEVFVGLPCIEYDKERKGSVSS